MPSAPVRRREDTLPQKEKTVKSEFSKIGVDENGRFKPNENDLKVIAALKKKFEGKEWAEKEDRLLPWQQPWL